MRLICDFVGRCIGVLVRGRESRWSLGEDTQRVVIRLTGIGGWRLSVPGPGGAYNGYPVRAWVAAFVAIPRHGQCSCRCRPWTRYVTSPAATAAGRGSLSSFKTGPLVRQLFAVGRRDVYHSCVSCPRGRPCPTSWLSTACPPPDRPLASLRISVYAGGRSCVGGAHVVAVVPLRRPRVVVRYPPGSAY